MIHVIGDSHCNVFGDTPYFTKFWLRSSDIYEMSKTAHQLQRDIDGLNNYLDPLPQDDEIIFGFGEIDCRLHFYRKHIENRTPLIDLIQTTVKRYIDVVTLYRDKFKQVYIMHAIPTGVEDNIWNHNIFAPKHVRKLITEMFNYELEKICKEYDIPFLDVYYQMLNQFGWRNEHFVRDDCHLNTKHPELIYKKYFAGE